MKENDGLVECPSCNKNVSPRLWHNHVHSWLFKSTTAHICPICGVTMYRTGKSGLTPIALIIIFIMFVVPMLQGIGLVLSGVFANTMVLSLFTTSAFIIVALVLLSFKYPRIKTEFNYIKTMVKTYF